MSNPELETSLMPNMEGDLGQVAELAFGHSRTNNNLGIPSSEIRDGTDTYLGMVVAVQSELVAHGRLKAARIVVEDEQIAQVAEQPSMTASATLIGLWPNGNAGAGEASLHETSITFTPEPDRHAEPFQETVLAALQRLNRRLNLHAPTVLQHDKHARHGDGLLVVDGTGHDVTVFPTADTRLSVEVAGRQELDREVGIRGVMRGPVVANLGSHSLLHITAGAVHALAASNGTRIELPDESPLKTKVIKVPETALGDYSQSFVITKPYSDELNPVRYVSLAGKEPERTGSLNPTLSVDEVASLAEEPFAWTDITDAWIDPHDRCAVIKNILSLDWAEVRLEALFAQARNALETSRDAQPVSASITGCLLVAAALRALPKAPVRDHRAVTVAYFDR